MGIGSTPPLGPIHLLNLVRIFFCYQEKLLKNFKNNFLDTYIQKAKKTYQDSRSRGARNIGTLNTELHDVQRIMVQNIDDVLQRGAVLSGKFLSTINI